MKKLCSFMLAASLLLSVFSFGVNADEVKPVSVTLNGNPVDCASYGQNATIVEGRTLVPLRAIFEALGASVEWNQDTKTVTSTLDGITINLTIGEKTLYKNGQAVEIDVPAQLMNGRTMVPARAVAESFGVSVDWSAEKRTVVLMTVPDTPLAKYNADLNERISKYVPMSRLDSEILGTVNNLPLSGAAVRYGTMSEIVYRGYGYPAEAAKEMILQGYRQDAGIVSLAYKNMITVTDEEIEAVVNSTRQALEQQYGTRLSKALEESPYTLYYYCLNSVYSSILLKLQTVYMNDSEFEEEVRTRTLEYLKENDYVRAKHILIMFPETEQGEELTQKQREETLAKANAVLKEVNAMSDIGEFDALIEKYNQDPGMKSNPDGYYFKKNEMVKPFEEAAYNLKEGKTSGIVETNYGYHILLRLPVDDDCLANSEVYNSLSREMVVEILNKDCASYEIVYADNFDERCADFEKEYNNLFS